MAKKRMIEDPEVITLYLTKALIGKLRKRAEERKVSVSHLVREILEKALEESARRER